MSRSSRRTSIFKVTTRDSESQRAVEKELSEEFHQNLRLLAYFQPYSDTLNAMISKEMFNKANTKGFQHVTHYLFSIYDMNQFKKTFHWPIYNKSVEAEFRNAALAFFNESNRKFNWSLEAIKMQTILFPSGVDFLKIVLEFSNLAMRKLLKLNNCSDINGSNLTPNIAENGLAKIKILYENGTAYCKKIESKTEEMKESTKQLTILIEEILQSTSFRSTDVLDGSLNARLQLHNSDIRLQAESYLQLITLFGTKCQRLETDINNLCECRQINFNSDEFMKFLNHLKQINPRTTNFADEVILKQTINFDKLLHCFELFLSSMLIHISTFRPFNLGKLRTEYETVNKLSSRVNNANGKLVVCQENMDQMVKRKRNSINLCRTGDEQLNSSLLPINIRAMVLTSPSISFETIERSININNNTKFLSLLTLMNGDDDDFPLLNKESVPSVIDTNTVDETEFMPATKKFRTDNNELLRKRTAFESACCTPSGAINMLKKFESRSKMVLSSKRKLQYRSQSLLNSTTYAANNYNGNNDNNNNNNIGCNEVASTLKKDVGFNSTTEGIKREI